MARVVHFEIPADDPERAVRFYEQAFGWQIGKWEGPQDYWLATTGEGPGIDGAIARREDVTTVCNTIGVASLESTLEAVKAAGGRVLTPTMTIPGVGRMAYCADTEGNKFGVIQPEMPAG